MRIHIGVRHAYHWRTMSTKELQQKAVKAIEGLSDKALVELIDLLEKLDVTNTGSESDEALIERIIDENRYVLARLAKCSRGGAALPMCRYMMVAGLCVDISVDPTAHPASHSRTAFR